MRNQFPQYLSAPFQILWFEVDELIIFFMFLILALMYEAWPLWVLMFVAPVVFGKIKSRYPRGFLKHMLYFCGLLSFEGYPSYFEERFTE